MRTEIVRATERRARGDRSDQHRDTPCYRDLRANPATSRHPASAQARIGRAQPLCGATQPIAPSTRAFGRSRPNMCRRADLAQPSATHLGLYLAHAYTRMPRPWPSKSMPGNMRIIFATTTARQGTARPRVHSRHLTSTWHAYNIACGQTNPDQLMQADALVLCLSHPLPIIALNIRFLLISEVFTLA